MAGRPAETVDQGTCPSCGRIVQTPSATNLCVCGQWLVNRTEWIGSKEYLYARRAPNKKLHAYVVTMNDGPEAIVFGSEEYAESVKEVFKKAYVDTYLKNLGQPPQGLQAGHWGVVKTPVYKEGKP